jgi:hypothetical protein
VSGAVGQLRDALDAGRTVHARVLSGTGYGVGTTAAGKNAASGRARRLALGAPPEEHSLLIIGFDGDTFVFSDPDAAVSHTPEPGFGELHLDATDNRLSTAENPADMAVTPDGEHSRGDKRYQIIRIETV